MSQTTVSRIWRAFGLRPHQVETWKLPTDPQFIDTVCDIVGLYLDPPERALVLCVDEKSGHDAVQRLQHVGFERTHLVQVPCTLDALKWLQVTA